MKLKYENWNPSTVSLEQVHTANSILDEYSLQGYTLTLRQLYYQFVARDLLENSAKAYKNLGSLIAKGRNAGLIDWLAIEDRGRTKKGWLIQPDHKDIVKELHRELAFDMWAPQDYYVEVWVEKEALAGIVKKACNSYRIPYLSCKGYLSASEAWRAGQRMYNKSQEGKKCIVIHLGDHDPSGIDMTRDNRHRLDLYSLKYEVQVERIALNMAQIEELQPPKNYAKVSDSRAKDYIQRYGRSSWELDALEPDYIVKLIRTQAEKYLDLPLWNETLEAEDIAKDVFRDLNYRWKDVVNFLR